MFCRLPIIALLVLTFVTSAGYAYAGADVPTAARLQNLAPSEASPPANPPATAPTTALPAGSSSMAEYVLGTGDRIRLTVYGEDDLSGEYDVSSTGVVALPLIGELKAAGSTIQQFEEAVATKLKAGYLNDPRVSVQVADYRPFFIIGEVSKPGSYPYVNGMKVLNAVALAGGYTYRADEDGIRLRHASDPDKKEQRVKEDTTVQPGDIIRVPERLF